RETEEVTSTGDKMRSPTIRSAAFWTALITFAATSGSALAQKRYDTGATDTEVKIGNIVPYSGPASAYGIIGKTEEAYFKMINENGGINGRKIKFISYAVFCSKKKTVSAAPRAVRAVRPRFASRRQGASRV